jgi:hypothetical protein
LTLTFLFTGERRFEHAVHEPALLQQTNGHAKISEERKRPPSINGKASDQRQGQSAPTPACELARALDPGQARAIINEVAQFCVALAVAVDQPGLGW